MQKMFQELRLLDKQKDKELVIYPLDNFSYAKETFFFPLGAQEIGKAAISYPIFFVQENSEVIPVALLGIQNNKFVDDKGKWKEGFYIPNVVKSYPFGSTKVGEAYSLIIDNKYVSNKKRGERFFDDNGELSEYGKKIVDFVQDTYADIERIKSVCKDLKEFLSPVEIDIKQSKKEYKIKGMYRIEEKTFRDLDEEKLYELFQKGSIDIIYAHFISLNNLHRVA